MLPTVYSVKGIGAGYLSVMGRPRAGEWAAEEFEGFRTLGITEILSLLEAWETQELGLAAESDFCGNAGIEFRSYPIPDRGLPTSADELGRLACGIYHRCEKGAHAAIHCRAGIGRSGLVGAAVLLHCGLGAAEAFSVLSKARGVSVPDTEEQANWLVEHPSTVSVCRSASQ